MIVVKMKVVKFWEDWKPYALIGCALILITAFCNGHMDDEKSKQEFNNFCISKGYDGGKIPEMFEYSFCYKSINNTLWYNSVIKFDNNLYFKWAEDRRWLN